MGTNGKCFVKNSFHQIEDERYRRLVPLTSECDEFVCVNYQSMRQPLKIFRNFICNLVIRSRVPISSYSDIEEVLDFSTGHIRRFRLIGLRLNPHQEFFDCHCFSNSSGTLHCVLHAFEYHIRNCYSPDCLLPNVKGLSDPLFSTLSYNGMNLLDTSNYVFT